MALRTPLSVTPHLYMGDSTGRPLDMGTVYFGEQDKDPEFYPINLFSDDALTLPLAQPVHTKGGYLYDKGDMVEPHAKEIIYSVKVLDSYGRKVFYKGAMMRNSWNDDVIEQINEAILASGDVAKNAFDKAADEVVANAANSVMGAIAGVAIDANLVSDALTTIVPIATGANARTQLEKNRENVSVFDFFTKAELDDYKADKTTFDAYRPLQAFLTHISDNDVGTARADGVFWISSGLLLGGANKSKTKNVIGCLDLYALNPIDTMFLSQTGHDFTWSGSIRVTGTGSRDYATRTCRVGIQIGGDYDGARSQYGILYARYFSQFGVMFENNTTLSEAENIKAYDCGSGFGEVPDYYSVTATYTSVQKEGSQVSTGQRSVLSVDTLPPELPANMPLFVAVGTDYYFVYDIDRVANTLTVFPWLAPNTESGNLRYLFGAGVSTRGSDANIIRIGRIDSQRCGIAMHDMALFGTSIGSLCAQAVGVGYAMGNNPSAVNIAGGINDFYCEGNDIDILRVSRMELGKSIRSVYISAPHKIRYTTAARLNSGEFIGFDNMKSITWELEGSQLTYEEFTTGSDSKLELTSAIRTPSLVNRDSHIFNIQTPNLGILNNFGIGSREIKVSGTGDEGRPTGNIVFNAPSGYTVNGQAQVSFSGFTRYADFYVFLAPSSTDIKVYCANLTSANTATTAYAAQTIPANASVTNNVTVTGIALGDIVAASLDKSLAGTVMSASVVSANTVAVTHTNPTDSSVSLAASNLKIKIN